MSKLASTPVSSGFFIYVLTLNFAIFYSIKKGKGPPRWGLSVALHGFVISYCLIGVLTITVIKKIRYHVNNTYTEILSPSTHCCEHQRTVCPLWCGNPTTSVNGTTTDKSTRQSDGVPLGVVREIFGTRLNSGPTVFSVTCFLF